MDAPPVQYVTTSDGWSIAYTVSGEGTPLVYVSSPFDHARLYWTTPSVFRDLLQALAARFKLICYDSRGQGMSSRGLPEDFRIEDFETDLEAVVGHLQLDRFVLLAFHGSARVAIKYAAQHPERVLALILVNANTGDPSLDTRSTPSDLEEVARRDWDLFVEAMARLLWPSEELAVGKAIVRESITRADYLRRARAWPSYNVAALLHKLRAPTLVMAPSTIASPYSREETSRHIAARIPGARLAVFDDPGARALPIGPVEDFVRSVEVAEQERRPAGEKAALPDGLSAREVEVLRLITAGKSNQQIAAELVITLNTVQHHVSNILTKTGLTNRTEAAAYAHRQGLV